MRVHGQRNHLNLDKADIGANAARMVSASTNMAPMLGVTSIAYAERDRFTHEQDALRRLCKVYGLDADALLAEVHDYMTTTTADWRRACKWARELIQRKPERLRV